MKNLDDNVSRSLLPNWGEGEDEGSPKRHTALTPTLSLNRERGNSKSVLFLSLSGIGNLVMQLPAIEAVKKAHPAWHITVWVAPRGTKSLAEAQPYIDEVIEMSIKANILQHLKNIFQLRKQRFDIGIVLSPGQLIKSALYMKLAGIKKRIGNKYPLRGNMESSFLLTDAISEKLALHDIEQNLRLLEPLNIPVQTDQPYSLVIPEKNIEEAISYKLKAKSYVGFHAGCAVGFEWKRWPLERFAEVANALIAKNPEIKILVFGGPDEEAQKKMLVEMINKGEGKERGAFAFPISASLLTTAAIMQRCKLMIANDSGLMHIAAAVGVPVIGLFGPTDEHLTGPRGKNSVVLRAVGTKPVYNTESSTSLGSSSHETMLAITPRNVLDKAVLLLK